MAQKGAATNAKGKYREKLKRLNRHLIRCEIMNEDPFPGDILGQRERALRLFEDEKALDNMPDTGWTSVPINREELRCIKKPPPIKKFVILRGINPTNSGKCRNLPQLR
ncbi:MAG: hypothetical protein HZT40_06970 [Candidatus Thiothrix singaporensis]|uniref:Uncharacterized protein n=1 Tax=Candidatus Thiothrix singaporensis TaxID=2799669 RepID=A0A7L6AQL6_9GAMM|nr:MAG: hypothetical protein HZT40_06970 [Candidatus Thiothrix singaporensis]